MDYNVKLVTLGSENMNLKESHFSHERRIFWHHKSIHVCIASSFQLPYCGQEYMRIKTTTSMTNGMIDLVKCVSLLL
jgi:hypothetical protein